MNNISSNDQTLQAYEKGAGLYADATPSDATDGIKSWLDMATDGLSANASILEIGSATGRDARYLISKGFGVQCTDAAQSFVDLLIKNGLDAHKFNVLTDVFYGKYDLIVANAVFVHFTHKECRVVLDKIFQALNGDGRVAFTVIEGEGESWTDSKVNAQGISLTGEKNHCSNFSRT